MEKLYEVKVNNTVVETIEDGFGFNQGELLWQAMSEQARKLNINGISDTETNLSEWEDLNDDNIEVLLEYAKQKGFVGSYEINKLN